METIFDQLESKAQIEQTPSPKRDKLYRQSHRRSACFHQADGEAISPFLRQGLGFLADSDLTPSSG